MIDPERVNTIFHDCLYRRGEDTSGHVKAEGITCNVGFHPERLEGHRAEVSAMLVELPDTFRRSSGGGWSFLNACVDREGNQWTGDHHRMMQARSCGRCSGCGRVESSGPRPCASLGWVAR